MTLREGGCSSEGVPCSQTGLSAVVRAGLCSTGCGVGLAGGVSCYGRSSFSCWARQIAPCCSWGPDDPVPLFKSGSGDVLMQWPRGRSDLLWLGVAVCLQRRPGCSMLAAEVVCHTEHTEYACISRVVCSMLAAEMVCSMLAAAVKHTD